MDHFVERSEKSTVFGVRVLYIFDLGKKFFSYNCFRSNVTFRSLLVIRNFQEAFRSPETREKNFDSSKKKIIRPPFLIHKAPSAGGKKK